MLLFRGELGVDPAVLWPTAVVVGGGALLAKWLAWRAVGRPPRPGTRDCWAVRPWCAAPMPARARAVLLEGAWWTVRGRDAPIAAGKRVRVVDLEGLDLIVEGADPEEGRYPEEEGGS